MSEISRNIALGAAAVGAGGVILGSAILGNSLRSNSANISHSVANGNGGVVTLTVQEPNPTITILQPAEDDVFLTNSISTVTNFKDTKVIGFTLTSPANVECALPSHSATTDAWASQEGDSFTQDISLATCDGGQRGQYKLKANALDWNRQVTDEIIFNYARFEFGNAIYDRNGDPIVTIKYGSGIHRVDFSAYCNGDSENDILNQYDYKTEYNDDYIDEVLLPFKNKNVASGTCEITATAKKKNGDPINSIDASGATIRKIINYTGV